MKNGLEWKLNVKKIQDDGFHEDAYFIMHNAVVGMMMI